MSGAVGVVPLEGRGSLPLLDLHGEALLLHSVRTLLHAGVGRVMVTTRDRGPDVQRLVAGLTGRVVVVSEDWWRSAGQHERLVVMDPLCPLVPADFVLRALEHAPPSGSVAGYRPVTDTVKTVVDQQIAGTLDRDALAIVTSPVVLAGGLLDGEAPPAHDFALLVGWLRKRGELALLKAPSMARRVGDESALRVLECVDELGRRVHEA